MIAHSKADVRYRIARSAEDRAAAYRLVHKAYVDARLDDPNPHRMRAIPHHMLPTTEIFIAELPARRATIATVSLVADGAMGIPMESIFAEEIAARRALGRPFAEVSCLAESTEHLESGFGTVVKIMGLMAQCAWHRGILDLMIAVHPRHVRFYERFIAFRQIAEERSYELVRNNPAVPMVLELDRLADDNPKAYERFFGTPFPEELLRARTVRAWDLSYLEQVRQVRQIMRHQHEGAPAAAGRPAAQESACEIGLQRAA